MSNLINVLYNNHFEPSKLIPPRTALHHSNLRIRRTQLSPAHSHINPSKIRPQLRPYISAIPPDQIILPPPLGPFPLRPRHHQLLPIIHDRPPLHPAQLHRPYQPGIYIPSNQIRIHHDRLSRDEPAFSPSSLHSYVLVYGRSCICCSHASSLRMGCVGNVDAGRCLVCLVACLVDGVCVVGIFGDLGPTYLLCIELQTCEVFFQACIVSVLL